MTFLKLLSPFALVRYCTLWGGGGGGGPSNYSNLDQLYGVQAQAAQFMLDQAMPRIPEAMDRSGQMVDEAFDGTLSQKMRDQAGADASQSLGMGLAAANRNMARYGAEFNPNKMGKASDDVAFNTALLRTGAMNKAGQWVEDQKWNRNAGYFGQVSGMNNGAMSGISSAASGMAGIAGQQDANARANAMGYGKFGAGMMAAATAKNGGYIDGEAVRLADGGDAWSAYKAKNPIKRVGGTRKVNALEAIAAGAAPHAFGVGLKEAFKGKDSWYAKKWTDLNKPAATDSVVAKEPASYLPASDNAIGPETGAVVENTEVAQALPVEDVPVVEATDIPVDTVADTGSEIIYAAGGGYIKKPGLRFALGGGVMKGVAAMDASSQMSVSGMDASNQMKLSDAGAKPIAAPVAKAAPAEQSTLTTGETVGALRAGSRAYDTASAAEAAKSASATADTANNASAAAEAADKANTAVTAAEGADAAANAAGSGTGAYGAALKAAVDIANGKDATTSVANAAGGWAGAEAGAAAGASVGGPYGAAVGAIIGGLAGSSMFAKGGQVRDDKTGGGEVSGPGTETSDDIPAWLSDGEVVHNADAVKLAGKNALLKINNEGLAARRGEKSPAEAKKAIGKVMVARGKQLAGLRDAKKRA